MNKMSITELNRLQDEDDAFRDKKENSQDPQDKAWVEADNQHFEAKLGFSQAQQDRAKLANAEPEAWDRKGRAQWEQDMKGATVEIDQQGEQLKSWAAQATPEEIEKVQQSLDQDHDQANEALRKRQSLGLMPSEQEEQKQTEKLSMEQKIEQDMAVPTLNVSRIREQRGEDGQQGPATWAEHVAGSKEAAEDDRKLQERQHQFVQENGRWPRGGEIEKIEAAEQERDRQKRARSQ